jgi:hypothetical protein
MPRPRNSWPVALAAVLFVLTGCGEAQSEATLRAAAKPKLGLMTSLPLYWPEGADLAALAGGGAAPPWQRQAIEARFAIVPLDTLSPITALSPDAPPSDPLAGLERLAVIQPRGLSPADNVALDDWVRGGGRLLLVLDPVLTGEYTAAVGDPRRPVDIALIPPVVQRWGVAVQYDDEQSSKLVDASLSGNYLPLLLAGDVMITDPAAADCEVLSAGAAARCSVGKGQVTLIADAALFEHPELAGEDGGRLGALMAAALE